MLDFQALKRVPLTDVCARYGIALTFGGKYAKAKCPLPGHKVGDKDKNFNINLEENYWKCWSGSCNQAAGSKGGDVINFVALMERCSQHDAAKKLSDWFPGNGKAAPRIEKRPAVKAHKEPSQGTNSQSTSPVEKVQTKGFMKDFDAWFDAVIQRTPDETDEVYWKRLRTAFKSMMIHSFRNGKAVALG